MSVWYSTLENPNRVYSLRLENTTLLKHYSCQILSHKIFSFYEQTLKMGANDASGQGLQFAVKNKHQYIFFEEITGIRSQVPAIFTENNETVLVYFN